LAMESHLILYGSWPDTIGSISQTLTYPFDVLRRKMQVIGLGPGALGYQYDSALDAARVIFKTEGIRGMYRGLWPNLCECRSCQVARFVSHV
jgi:solute carrier family 25 phosphate transporter 23/24/25/41